MKRLRGSMTPGGLRAMPGETAPPEKLKALEEAHLARQAKKRAKVAERKLKAQGFEMGNFLGLIKNLRG
jgi:hypothetical protein